MQPGDKAFRHEWLRRMWASSLATGSKTALMGVFFHADNFGFCWPNQEQILRSIGRTSAGRLSQQIRTAVEEGWVTIGKGQGRNGWPSNNYQLYIPTQVGTNSPRSLLISGVTTPEILEKRASELAPTGVGAQVVNGELGPTTVGQEYPAPWDSDFPDVDLRDPPPWAFGP